MNGTETTPRHGHRTPAEIAEDEVLAALRGEARDAMPEARVLPERCKRVVVSDGVPRSRKEEP